MLTAASGWATLNEVGGHWLEDVHEAFANGMLALVIVHVAAVLLSSWLQHENLIGAMIHGRKPVPAQQGIRNAWRSVAALVLAAVLGFWWLQWQQPAPADGIAARSLPVGVHRSGHDDD